MADPVGPGEKPWFTTPAAMSKLNGVVLKKEIQLRSLVSLGKLGDLRKILLNCMPAIGSGMVTNLI